MPASNITSFNVASVPGGLRFTWTTDLTGTARDPKAFHIWRWDADSTTWTRLADQRGFLTGDGLVEPIDSAASDHSSGEPTTSMSQVFVLDPDLVEVAPDNILANILTESTYFAITCGDHNPDTVTEVAGCTPVLNETTLTVPSTAGILAGSVITGDASITGGTYVLEVSSDSELEMSEVAASTPGAPVDLTFTYTHQTALSEAKTLDHATFVPNTSNLPLTEPLTRPYLVGRDSRIGVNEVRLNQTHDLAYAAGVTTIDTGPDYVEEANIAVGMRVRGYGIADDTYVTAVTTNSFDITLGKPTEAAYESGKLVVLENVALGTGLYETSDVVYDELHVQRTFPDVDADSIATVRYRMDALTETPYQLISSAPQTVQLFTPSGTEFPEIDPEVVSIRKVAAGNPKVTLRLPVAAGVYLYEITPLTAGGAEATSNPYPILARPGDDATITLLYATPGPQTLRCRAYFGGRGNLSDTSASAYAVRIAEVTVDAASAVYSPTNTPGVFAGRLILNETNPAAALAFTDGGFANNLQVYSGDTFMFDLELATLDAQGGVTPWSGYDDPGNGSTMEMKALTLQVIGTDIDLPTESDLIRVLNTFDLSEDILVDRDGTPITLPTSVASQHPLRIKLNLTYDIEAINWTIPVLAKKNTTTFRLVFNATFEGTGVGSTEVVKTVLDIPLTVRKNSI